VDEADLLGFAALLSMSSSRAGRQATASSTALLPTGFLVGVFAVDSSLSVICLFILLLLSSVHSYLY
jgi:hypothetical protein